MNVASMNSPAQIELHKQAVAFEGFFVGILMRTMREGIHQTEMFHGGRGEEIFSSLQDDETSNRIAGREGLGIARMLEKTLGRQFDARA